MEFKNIGRNDLCPCGSGKKFKHCHLGREAEIVEARFDIDPIDAATQITALPTANHPSAKAMVEALDIQDKRGRTIALKLVDLQAYRALNLMGQHEEGETTEGGLVINPAKTEKLDPLAIYIALSPKLDDANVLHLLAHANDLVSGSRLDLGRGLELATEFNVPPELLEHPQEFGEILVALAEKFEVELDAENEVIAFLAHHEMLLPAKMLKKGSRVAIDRAIPKTLMFLNQHKAELDARLKTRQGYTGASAIKKKKDKSKMN